MQHGSATLASRMGKTTHVSPLQFKLEALRKQYPCACAERLEDWLVAVANARGARVVVLPTEPGPEFRGPPADALSSEELVVAICQLQRLDRPQMLRLAAQLVSRGLDDVESLLLVAERERAEPVLAELARQALKVDSAHLLWRRIRDAYARVRRLREPLLHWTRLAEPVMVKGRCNAESWRLVA